MAEVITGFQTADGVKKYDYNSLANKPESFSNALKDIGVGSIVRIDDVSPVIHEVKCKLKSKNLFNNADDFADAPGATHLYEEGALTVNGYYVNKYLVLESGKTYTLSFKSTRTGNYGGGIYIVASPIVIYSNTSTLSNTVTFTVPKGYSRIQFTFYGCNSFELASATFTEIMLEEGTEATEYVPYVDPANATLTCRGKNLIPCPYLHTSSSANGGTITAQDSGDITFAGTPTDYVGMTIYNGKALATSGTVTFSIGGNAQNALGRLFMYNGAGEIVTTISVIDVATINLDDYPTVTNWDITISRASNNKLMSGAAYPQIEVGDTRTEYELFKGSETYTPSADGTVNGLYSISPTMTLEVDTKNTVVEVEYQRDISGACPPPVNSTDNGKFLRVVNGAWAAVALTDVSQEGA